MPSPKKSLPQQPAQDARAEQLSAEIELAIAAAKRGALPAQTPRDFTNAAARKTAAARKKKPRG